jgi:hypothetical protein
MRDFTPAAFGRLLETALRCFGTANGVREWCRALPGRGVLVRHDVDRRPRNAVALAELEAALGVRTTYYFRVVGSAYDPRAMQRIAGLGHEVGYHYEDLSLAGGDRAKALELFERHLKLLRQHVDIRTITMHGSPLSGYNNYDVWKDREYRNFGIEADAFLDVDYSGMPYFTDTGRSWGAKGSNLRDHPPSAMPPVHGVRSSAEFASFLERWSGKHVAFSAHPERWDAHLTGWVFQYGKDIAANTVKRALRLARGG